MNCRTRLYRKAAPAVIFALLATTAVVSAFGQYGKKRQISKGPRAVGLIELAANGKAHLVPIAIMIDGKFYDAGAYKADPVPMALQPETVYEAAKSGASDGLFTVAGAMQGKNSWIADGKWQSEAEIEADRTRRRAEAAKRSEKAPEVIGGPPKLRRAPHSGSDSSSAPTQPSAPPSQNPSSNSGSTSSAPSSTQKPGSSNSGTPNTTTESPAFPDAPDRPILRRQPASEATQEQTKPGNEIKPLQGPIQFIPAISDSGGPEARPYTYELKSDEQQNFLKKMLALASDEVEARARHLSAESEDNPKARRNAHSTPAAEFQDVQFHVFDLTNSNEPVLVLTATASIPNSRLNLQYMTALVAREDIYGDLHKVFAQTTDPQHLDVLAKYDFIDAVDADGDGRGELLFRTTSDSGTAYSIYAVIGDRLWPLFEGKPGS
jgi:hypothetical protein